MNFFRFYYHVLCVVQILGTGEADVARVKESSPVQKEFDAELQTADESLRGLALGQLFSTLCATMRDPHEVRRVCDLPAFT